MKVKHLRFNNNTFKTSTHEKLDDINVKDDCVNWINITSLKYDEIIDSLESKFGISPLVIEDIKNVNLLPKVEDYKKYLFMILEEIKIDNEDKFEAKQLSLILFKNLIISIEEDVTDHFEQITRTLKDRANIIGVNADNIFYELVDMTVEDYFDVLERMGERIDDAEDTLLINPTKETLSQIYVLKKDLISTRKTLWLMRNAVSRLIRNEYHLIDDRVLFYFRECYDNLVQLIDLTETYRDICSGMLDIYLSSISNKTNDIMKVLTILSTIFIPLTFLAGIYGMNFEYFPEIRWKYGYIGFWVISLIITSCMIRFFKKKKWL